MVLGVPGEEDVDWEVVLRPVEGVCAWESVGQIVSGVRLDGGGSIRVVGYFRGLLTPVLSENNIVMHALKN